MTAVAQRSYVPADPIEVLRVRADVRGYLVHVGEYELHEAIDGLWFDAVRTGVVDRIGVDETQRILDEGFGRWRSDLG